MLIMNQMLQETKRGEGILQPLHTKCTICKISLGSHYISFSLQFIVMLGFKKCHCDYAALLHVQRGGGCNSIAELPLFEVHLRTSRKHSTHWNCCLPLRFHKGCNGKIAKIASAVFRFSFLNFLVSSTSFISGWSVYIVSFISLSLFTQIVHGTNRFGGTLKTICGLSSSVTYVLS